MIDAGLRRDLLERRARLVDRSRTEREGTPLHGDLGDLSAAAAEASMAALSETRRVQRVREIDAALARIAAGTFGDCTDCGDEIARARLKNNPTVERCIACQEAVERAERLHGRMTAPPPPADEDC